MCALTLCSFIIYAFIMFVIPKQYKAVANARMEREVTELAEKLDGQDYASASEAIYNFCIENHATAMLINGDQTVAFGEETAAAETENTSALSFEVHFSDLSGNSVLTVLSSASTAREITYTFLKMLPFVAVLIIMISAFSAWLCSRIIVKPVLQISTVSKRMAQMDMTWRCDEGRDDELGTLAQSLNTLSERLTQAMGELEDANAQLREEIAASRELERQRRDFFAAASHELKTPITVLKGQLESMLLGIGDYRDHEKYLPQALETVENMEELTREILTITKMEAGIPKSSFENEALAPILHTCIEGIEPLADEKKIVIDARQIHADIHLNMNRPLFQKAVSNILSNAVRYSPEGQRIIVTLTEEALTIENTGITIEEDDISSLFMPFYRADRSRNRRSGGSGLGLYIVKTVLDIHGLSCKLENQRDSVRFTVFLNQN